MTAELVLASTSPYRRALLDRLGIPFRCEPSGVHEEPGPGEPPEALVRRLARAKAEAVAVLRSPEALVIGSDQVAELDGEILCKPGTEPAALAQLERLSGRTHRLLTAVYVLGLELGYRGEWLEVTELSMRAWSREELAAYVARDRPLDCAGSYRLERLGVVLFDGLSGLDPTAVEGLPLMALSRLLGDAGICLLATAETDARRR